MTTRNEYNCYVGTAYEQKIVAWMTAHNHPAYGQAIADAKDTYLLTVAEAGPNWQHCGFTRERLELINKDIAEDFQAATDRYEDWASD